MCGAWIAIAIYAIMCATFVALWLGPLWFINRSERRVEEGGD